MHIPRRTFLASAAVAPLLDQLPAGGATIPLGSRMAFGLVTYQWAKDWDLPTLISNCEQAGVLGVELRTTHAHGVEPTLNRQQRLNVQQRFAASEVELVGVGSDERFDNPDASAVKKAIEATKSFIRLSHDVGGSGVKVKPDRFHPDVPRERTIEQIGNAIREVAEYGQGFGQQIRLEVHGQCAELPTMAAIMKVADHPNAALCWNSNKQDLLGEGLAHNFEMVRKHFGRTCHVRPLDDPTYPYTQLIELLVKSDYDGWVMLESGEPPANVPAELKRQAELFKKLVTSATASS